jgi:exodeoxyribonuclease-5
MSVTFDQLSPDQVIAVERAVEWYNSPFAKAEPFYLRGPAGSGKTTVAAHILAAMATTTQALAPTNRAAKILRNKGVHNAMTIHKVLFIPTPWCWTQNHTIDKSCEGKDSHQHGVRFFKREDPPLGVRCFTIDEASMVGDRIARDIAMFKIPTLVIGDPYQLPPVGDAAGYTTDLPGVELDSMHRFDSLSDIGKLANIIRLSSGLSEWKDKIPYVGFEDRDKYDLILAWRNETRWQIINTLRSIRGLDLDTPQVGDRLLSVANCYEIGVLNADEFTVVGEPYPSTHLGAWNIPTQEKGVIPAWKIGFRDFEGEKWAAQQSRHKGSAIAALTWSECMTVHKAQGGEWENVLVVDDLEWMDRTLRNEPGSVNTWAYTAVTRASKQVDFIKINEFPTGMTLRRMVREAAEVAS